MSMRVELDAHSATFDLARVRAWLTRPEQVLFHATGTQLSVVIDTEVPLAAIAPFQGPVDPDIWLASELNRRCRAVAPPEADHACACAQVLSEAEPSLPARPATSRTDAGLLMFKAGTMPTRASIHATVLRLTEVGYRVTRARRISAQDIRDGGFIRRHYADHWAIAERGRLMPAERVALLNTYDTAEFEARFGLPARDCEVAPALEFVRVRGIPPGTLSDWSDARAKRFGLNSGALLGPNEVGDLTCVTLLTPNAFHDGPPVFLLNPHMITVVNWFEDAPAPVVALWIEAARDNALSWDRMRAEVCGTSDPATAIPGSLRRDIWEGLIPLPYAEGIVPSRIRNAIHLSNGPVEALREAAIWFGLATRELPLGRVLTRADDWPGDVLRSTSHIDLDGERRILVDATAGLSPEAVAALLAGGRPAAASDGATLETQRRIDLAHAEARRMSREEDIRMVMATGSTAMNRCSAAADIDLIAIHGGNVRRVDEIDRTSFGGLAVEVQHLSLAEAEAIVAPPVADMRALKRASRIDLALVLYDPGGTHPRLSLAARDLTPDAEGLSSLVLGALATLTEQRERQLAGQRVDWHRLRDLADTLAYCRLLVSRLRYQKPKWVLDDLRRLGDAGAVGVLTVAHDLASGKSAAASSISGAREFVESAAQLCALPDIAATRARGLLPDAPEYSYLCQALTDAEDLVDLCMYPDAAFAARFALKMTLSLPEVSELPGAERSRLLARYRALAPAPQISQTALDDWFRKCLALADRCRIPH